ncbi:MAG: GNAT family N-acetyltransferase [Acidimicrobiales bacterium]
MQLRLAAPSDAEAIRSIYNSEVTGSTSTFDLVPRDPEDQLAWLAHHSGVYPAVVALDNNGVVVGFGSLSEYRNRPAYATTVENSVYVDAGKRGCGIGRALLDELIRLAGHHGFHTVVARIGGENKPSITLHRTCGFDVVGVEREIGRKFGRWLDVWVLQRML